MRLPAAFSSSSIVETWRRIAPTRRRTRRYGRSVAAPHACSSASSQRPTIALGGSRARGHDPQRAAVDRQPLDTADGQAVALNSRSSAVSEK